MLVNKDEKLKKTPAYLGFLLLKQLAKSKDNKLMIYDIAENLKQYLGIVHHRQFVFSLIFLYQAGVIDFSEPYIYKK